MKSKIDNQQATQVIEALNHLKQNPFVQEIGYFSSFLENIIKRLSDNSFRLAVVGEFSSGKSTFLNALIGRDILKHGTKETTAAITEIQNQVEDSSQDVFDVFYLDGKKEQNIPLELLSEYTATSSKTHQVAQEISKVIIKSHVLSNKGNVCFVDTPGLNGVADNHREKTIEQIKNAHACIYLLQVRGLSESDRESIRFISEYQHNIIFVQNFIDELKEMEGETPAQKVAAQKKILDEDILKDVPDVMYSIVGISALKALVAQDKTISEFDGKPLTEQIRQQLYRESQFESIKQEIHHLMEANIKGLVQKRDTIQVALKFIDSIESIALEKHQQEKELWNKSEDGKAKFICEKIKEHHLSNKERYIQNIQNFIEVEFGSTKREIKKIISKNLEEALREIEHTVKRFKNIDEYNDYISTSKLSNTLNHKSFDMETQCNEYMKKRMDGILSNAIIRIQEYMGIKASHNNVPEFQAIQANFDNYISFQQEKDTLERYKDDRDSAKSEYQIQLQQQKKQESDISRLDSDISSQNDRKASLDRKNQSELNSLGPEPEQEEKYHEEIKKRPRGGLGFLDWLLGPEEYTERVTYYDDSKQQEWRQQRENIRLKYQKQKDEINNQQRFLQLKRQRCQEDMNRLNRTIQEKKREVERMEVLIEAKQEELKIKLEKAEQEYLRNMIDGLLANVRKYLYENVGDVLINNFSKALDKNKERLTNKADSIFEDYFEQEINSLEQRIQGHQKEIDTSAINCLLDELQKVKNMMEGYLC